MRVNTLLIATTAMLLSSTAINAQDNGYDPSLFSALRWHNIGPNRGGRSIAASGSVGRPYEFYFCATGG